MKPVFKIFRNKKELMVFRVACLLIVLVTLGISVDSFFNNNGLCREYYSDSECYHNPLTKKCHCSGERLPLTNELLSEYRISPGVMDGPVMPVNINFSDKYDL